MPPFPRASSNQGPVNVGSFKRIEEVSSWKPFSRKRAGNKTGATVRDKKSKLAKVVDVNDISKEFLSREREEIISRTKSLNIGSTVVCVVTRITGTHVFVDLPRNEAGVIPLTEIAEEGFAHLTSQLIRSFKPHDLLIAVITATTAPAKQNRKNHLRYKLSLRPSRIFPVNAGFLPVKNQLLPVSITSVEEHGLMAVWTADVCNAGSSYPPSNSQSMELSSSRSHTSGATKVFIKSDSASTFSIGQIVYAVVDSVKRDQQLVICRLEKEFSGRFLSQKASVDVGGLCAGQLVECTILGVLSELEQTNNNKTGATMPAMSTDHSRKWPLENLFPPHGTNLTISLCGALNATVPNAHLHNAAVALSTAFELGQKGLPLAASFPFYPSKGEEVEGGQKKESTARQTSAACPHFEAGQQFIGRVVCVNKSAESAQSSIIYVSALPHLVHFRIPTQLGANLDQVTAGSVIDEARVIKSDLKDHVTLLFQSAGVSHDAQHVLPQAVRHALDGWKIDPNRLCLCRCEKGLVADQLVEKEILSMKFGQKKTCRVLEKNYCEGLVTVALSGSFVDSQGEKLIEQFKIGQLVSGTVKKCFDWGAFVALSAEVDGKIETLQLQDNPSSVTSSLKIKEGQTGKFRILYVDNAFKTVTLTAKKSFLRMAAAEVESQLNPSQIKLNDTFNMYVLNLKLKGLILRGLGDFKGMLRYEDAGLHGYDSEEKYQENFSLLKKALTRKNLAPGCSCRVRVDRIVTSFAGMDMSIEHSIIFSLDLDKVAPPENHIDQTRSAMSLATLSLDSRLQKASPITKMDIANKTYQELVDRALQLLPAGSVVDGIVQNIHPGSQTMQLAVLGSVRCTLHVMELAESEKLEDFMLNQYHIGQILPVRIVGPPPIELPKRTMVFLEGSIRTVNDDSSEDHVLPREISDLTVGETLVGVALGVDFTGLLVAVSSSVKVRVKFCYLSGAAWEKAEGVNDIEKAKKAFPLGSIIKQMVIRSISYKHKRAEGTMKMDEFAILMKLQGLEKVNFESVQENRNYVARVTSVKEFGVFVAFENSDDDLTGLCHLNEILDKGAPADLASMYNQDDMVLVKVIKKDGEKQRIAVSMKPSHFNDVDFSELASPSEKQSASTTHRPRQNDDSPASTAASLTAESPSVSELPSKPAFESTFKSAFELTSEPAITPLDMGREWLDEEWQPKPEESSCLVESLTAVKETPSKKAGKKKDDDKKAKVETLAEREKRLRTTERQIASGVWAENPQTVDDFERLILIDGNDSDVWIRYMSHFADRQDFERARAIAERGVTYMDISRDEERRNIWLAWINLESHFGTKESRQAVWERALQCNEAKPIYMHILNLLEDKAEMDEAVAICKRMTKKLPSDISCWLRYLSVLYSKPVVVSSARGLVNTQGQRLNRSERQDIEEVIRKALKSLNGSEHIMLKSGVAKLEYKHGSSEVGRANFLEILKEKPKRTDVWNVFLDCQEREVKNAHGRARHENIELTRKLYVNATSVHLKVEKMKRLLKKWMEFEKTYGSEAGEKMCTERALNYVAERQK